MAERDRHWQARRVLVGYDGTEGGLDAIAVARALAEPDAEFLLVDVIAPVGLFVLHPRLLAAGEPPQSDDFFVEALGRLEGRRVETRSYVANSAAHVLSDLAEKEAFDLVAIGPCPPTALGRAILGSVAQGLLNGAVAPVAVAPRGYGAIAAHPIGRIAVAYDGSPEAREALRHAEALARREGARLVLLTVDVRQATLPGVIGWEPLIPKSPDQVLAAGRAEVATGIEVEGRVLDGGSVAATIAAYCAQGSDLLVVGSRGYGPLGRVFLGSVATGLLHRASCPVLTVPRPPASADEPSFWDAEAAVVP